MFNLETGPREPEEEIPQQTENKDGLIRESLGKRVQGVMNESRLPNEEYESTVGVYGGERFGIEGALFQKLIKRGMRYSEPMMNIW